MKRFFSIFLLLFTFYSFSQNSINTNGGGLRWVSVGDIDVAGTQITVEAIWRKSNNSNAVNIVSKHTDPTTCNYLLRPNSFQIATSDNFFVCVNPVPTIANQWYHSAATYDGTSVKYYLNGCLVSEIPASGNIVTTDLITGIGMQSANPLATSENFRGNIDEVRIWNVARTQTELELNANFLFPTTQPGLLAYYKFDGDYTNVQGNAAFDGTPQGTVTFDVESNLFVPLAIIAVLPTDATCNGFSNGSIEITAVGNGNLTYSIDGTNFSNSPTFSGLSAGIYTVTVKSPEGCTLTQDASVGEPSPVAIPEITAPSTVCEGDTVTFSVDSLENHSISWFGVNSFVHDEFDTTFSNVSSALDGEYSAFYTFNGCNSDTSTYFLTVNPIFNLLIDTTICSNNPYVLGPDSLNESGQYALELQTLIGCDSIISLDLTVHPAYSFLYDSSFCENEIFEFQGQTINSTGTYSFNLLTTEGCDSVITFNIIVYPIPEAPVVQSNSPIVCPGDSFEFFTDSLSQGIYQWIGDNNFSSGSAYNSFDAEIEDIGEYSVNVTIDGCTSENSFTNLEIINVFSFNDFELPNVLTVNNDGINDILDLEDYFKTCEEFTFYLHDRLGQLVYSYSNGEDPFIGLDKNGNPLEDGVYHYVILLDKEVKQSFIHIIH